MKNFIFGVMVLGLVQATPVFAAEVKLGRAIGGPGDVVSLLLSIDPLEVDGFGGFSLGLDLLFDPTQVSFVPGSIKEVDLYVGSDDHPTDFKADFSDPPGLAFGSGKVSIELVASYFFSHGGVSPGAGGLITLDFLVASTARNEDIPIEILVSSFNAGDGSSVSSVSGSIAPAPIPLPPAALLLGAPLAWLVTRRKP